VAHLADCLTPKSTRMPEKVRKIAAVVEGFEGTDEHGSIGEYSKVCQRSAFAKEPMGGTPVSGNESERASIWYTRI
jgi:hypothetical protein